MGWWLLRLSAKVLALLRLSVNFLSFVLRVVLFLLPSSLFATTIGSLRH